MKIVRSSLDPDTGILDVETIDGEKRRFFRVSNLVNAKLLKVQIDAGKHDDVIRAISNHEVIPSEQPRDAKGRFAEKLKALRESIKKLDPK